MARQRPLPVLAAAPGATAAAASRRQCGTNEHGEKWLRMPRVVNFWEFFFFAAVNSRFSSNFYSLLGMDDEQTGFILGVRPLVGILSVPFWSWFADYRQDVRLTIRITAVISAVIFLSFSLVQLGVIPESWAFSYYLVTRCIFSLFFPPLWTLVDALSLGFFPPARQNEYGGERLWGAVGWSVGHMIIGILMDKFGASIFYVLDAIAVVLFVASMRLMPTQHVAPVVSARRTKRARATARQGESVKLLLVTEGVDGPAKNEENGTAFVTGGLIKSSGSGKKSGKTKKAATTAAQHAITPKQRPAGSDSTLSSKSSKKLQESRRTLPVPATAVLMGQFSWSEYIRQVRQVLCHDLASVVFFFDVFFFGAAFAFVEMLVFLFFVDELGASFALCGASVAVTVSFEIPIFYFSPWILARVSKKTLFVIAHLSYAVRVVGYTLVPNAFAVLLLEPLHGVTFACYQLFSIHYLSDLAPPNMQATAQGLKGTIGSVGTLVGSVVGGWLLQAYGDDGAAIMYRGGAVLMFASMVMYLLADHHLRKRQSAESVDTTSTVKPRHKEWGHDPDSPSVRFSATISRPRKALPNRSTDNLVVPMDFRNEYHSDTPSSSEESLYD